MNIKSILSISSFYLFISIIDKNGLTDGRRLIHRDRSILTCSSLFLNKDKHTMVGDFINTMKTTWFTFWFTLNCYQVRGSEILKCCKWYIMNEILKCCKWYIMNEILKCCKWYIMNEMTFELIFFLKSQPMLLNNDNDVSNHSDTPIHPFKV